MKSFKEFLSEESAAPTNVTGASVAGYATTLGTPTYRVPHTAFVKLTVGKSKGERWKKIVDDIDVAAELKKRLYAGKSTLLQCEEYPHLYCPLHMRR